MTASDPSQRSIGIQLYRCENALVEDNVIDLNTSIPVRHYASGTVKYFNNETPARKLLQGYDGTANQYVNELATDGDLTLLLSS